MNQATECALSAADAEAVQAAVDAVVGTSADGQPTTLNVLIERWRLTVKGMDEPYSWCAPEFHHDIRYRTILAEVWPRLPARVQALRQPELDRSDEIFRQVTVPWPGRPEDEDGWWTRRIPRVLEVEESELREGDWPLGWEMMPFPKPDSVTVTC
ncbi:hypothetical protein [Yinghuangia seranimata]|uniref:hypothetical protein n=1 Tax=Yinghuangia seranimata TaxID=408067 RepID=UPI00248C729F|nr:hypothetical protein [Yinghuangia seranimata]MDI2127601.1 hypothetical protein [Yinghuangia seranimata]